jgi:DNA-directed RNA polymerase specialized sigma24 family protein
VADALARLTARQRAVLVLRFYEDQTERETARALKCSVNTVKSQTRHALERLRVLAPELAEAFGRAEPTTAPPIPMVRETIR